MKKAVAGILALFVMCCMVACGNTTPQQDTTPATQTTPDTPADTASLEEKYPNFVTFDFPAATLSDSLKEFMQSKFSDAMASEPSVENTEDDDLIPACTAYTYDLGAGISLTLRETTATQKCCQVYLYAPISGQDDLHSRIGYAMGGVLGLLEPDEETGNRIMTELNVTNVTEPATTRSLGNISSWTYVVNEDSIMFSIMAK